MLIVAFACFIVLVVAWLIAAESVPEAVPAAPAAVTVEPAGAADRGASSMA